MARIIVPIPGAAPSTGGRPPEFAQYGRLVNRVVARGMGPHRNRLVARGYGGPPTFVTQGYQSFTLGQSGTKRRLQEMDELIVWAKLIQVNNAPAPPPKVQGWVRVHVANRAEAMAKVTAEHIASRTRAAWEVIKVTVQRLK
jgi:hypothetical protein